MKKLIYLFASLVLVAAMISCDKEMVDDIGVITKSSIVSTPTSDLGIVPMIIDGKNRGGNRTCEEVAVAWDIVPNPFYCGDKLDYGDFDLDGDYEFSTMWPKGLVVTVTDGKYVSFEMENCIMLGEKFYKVGAVIVKGSAKANVYYYGSEGTLGDKGLASPINASGSPASLSNLTFCFIECKEKPKELIIVLKTYLQTNGGLLWAGTYGTGSEYNSLHIGYIDYTYIVVNNHAIFLDANPDRLAGTLTAWDYVENGIRYLEINLSYPYNGYSFLTSYLYVGTEEGYSNYLTEVGGIVYTDYENFPFQMEENLVIRKFIIPFSDITE